MDITGKARELFDLLYTKEFDPEKLRSALATGAYSAEDVSFAGYMYVDKCIGNLMDENWEYHYGGIDEVLLGYESSHVYEAVKILLDYGLDPNAVYPKECPGDGEEFNIMWELRYVNNGYQAADTLALLLEHGGDPNLYVNGNIFVREINFDVWFETVNYEDGREIPYDALVHYWMVLNGYGATLEDGSRSIEPTGNFYLEKLKDHRQFYFGIVQPVDEGKDWDLCIFEKGSGRECARY